MRTTGKWGGSILQRVWLLGSGANESSGKEGEAKKT